MYSVKSLREDYQKVTPKWEPKNVYLLLACNPLALICINSLNIVLQLNLTLISMNLTRRDSLSNSLKLLNISWHFFFNLIPFWLTGWQKSATPLLCYAWNHLLLLWMLVLLNILVSKTNDSNFHLMSSCKHCQNLSAYYLSLNPFLTLLNYIFVF